MGRIPRYHSIPAAWEQDAKATVDSCIAPPNILAEFGVFLIEHLRFGESAGTADIRSLSFCQLGFAVTETATVKLRLKTIAFYLVEKIGRGERI